MPWQIDGTFLRVTNNTAEEGSDSLWQQDLAAGIKIIASRHDFHDHDLAGGIARCLSIDGYNQMFSNLNMGGYQITNIGIAGGLTDVALYGQCAGSLDWEVDTAQTLRLLDRNGDVIDSVIIPTGGGGGSGTVTSITAGGGLIGTPNPITLSGTIAMPVIKPGQTYSGGISTLTVDNYGRVTNVVTGAFANTNLSNFQGLINTSLYSSTGTGTVILNADATRSGVMTAAQSVKLDALPQFASGEVVLDFYFASATVTGTMFWTRVNNQVTITGRMAWSGLSDTSPLIISGLPYNVTANTANLGAGIIARCTNVDWGGVSNLDYTFMGLEGFANTNRFGAYLNFSLGSTTTPGQSNPMSFSNLGTSGYMDLSFTYRTDEAI